MENLKRLRFPVEEEEEIISVDFFFYPITILGRKLILADGVI